MAVQSVLLFIHVLVALLIVLLVLVQRGKGADAGAGFGAGASGTVFGSRGAASFFSRVTAVLATMFFATSLSLAYMSGQRTAPTSILEEAGGEQPQDFTPLPAFEPTELPELPSLPSLPPESAGTVDDEPSPE